MFNSYNFYYNVFVNESKFNFLVEIKKLFLNLNNLYHGWAYTINVFVFNKNLTNKCLFQFKINYSLINEYFFNNNIKKQRAIY